MAKQRRNIVLGSRTVAAAASPLDTEILTIARILRRVYCLEYRHADPSAADYGERHMPMWDGGKDRFGRQHGGVWPKAAEFIRQQQLDPFSYVHYMFAAAIGAKIPTPTMLYSEATLSQYLDYSVRIVHDLQHDWDNQLRAMDSRCTILRAAYPHATEPQILATAAGDPQRFDASPLFRYCIAVVINEPAIANHYYPAALIQYTLQQREYDAAWGDHIPSAMRDAGHAYRSRLAT